MDSKIILKALPSRNVGVPPTNHPPSAPTLPRSGSRNGFRWLLGEPCQTALEIFSKFRYFPICGFFPPSASLRLCARDIFMRCLARSRSVHPSGCLRQATRPAPAGTCSALRFPVSAFRCFSIRGYLPAFAGTFRFQVSGFRFPVSFSPNKTLHIL
jgi:hypothetical protein